MSTVTISLASGTPLLRSEICKRLSASNHASLAAYKAAFQTVTITQVKVTVHLRLRSDVSVKFGLFRSLAAAPANRDEAVSVPLMQYAVTDSRTATSHSATFTPATTPGLEWDLSQTAIRAGHPDVVLFNLDSVQNNAPNAADQIGTIFAEYTLELGGLGTGY